MARSTFSLLRFCLRHAAGDDGSDGSGGEEGVPRRPSPSEVNAVQNRNRLSRIEEISQGVDGRRASDLEDVDGSQVTGRFQGGEFDDSAEAAEARAQREEEEAEAALEEQRQRAEERGEEDEARRLQAEGAGGTRDDDSEPGADPDEKVVAGVRYYREIVGGEEKWLSAKQLRELARQATETGETLQRAQEALRSATHAELTPKEAPAEISEQDLGNIILSAGMGDEEAVKKLASVINRSQAKAPNAQQVSELVAQQIATQRAIDDAEGKQSELTQHTVLGPIFKQRLREFAQRSPQTRISDAYEQVGTQMRKDFAPLLSTSGRPPNGRPTPPASKADRKRTIVNPPSGAGRQPRREDDDREVPVSEQIDAMARARGQARAHRIRRS